MSYHLWEIVEYMDNVIYQYNTGSLDTDLAKHHLIKAMASFKEVEIKYDL